MDQRLSLSIAEAARACGIGRTSLYNAISNGDLRVIKHGRRVWREPFKLLSACQHPNQ